VRAAVATLEEGQEFEADLRFSVFTSTSSTTSSAQNSPRPHHSAGNGTVQSQNGTNGQNGTTSSAAAMGKYLLFCFIWNDHTDFGELSSPHGGGGFRYLSPECSKQNKIFSVIPYKSEVIWTAQELPYTLSQGGEAAGEIRFHDRAYRQAVLKRGILKPDTSGGGGSTSFASVGSDHQHLGGLHPWALALWKTALPKAEREIPFQLDLQHSLRPAGPAAKAGGESSHRVSALCRSAVAEARVTYKYYHGTNRKHSTREETCSGFSCAFCSFKTSSMTALSHHLSCCHDIFKFDWKAREKGNEYEINVQPPSKKELSEIFEGDSFTTVTAASLSEQKTKMYDFPMLWQSKNARRKWIRQLKKSIELEQTESRPRRSAANGHGNGHGVGGQHHASGAEAAGAGGGRKKKKRNDFQPRQPPSVFYHARTGMMMSPSEIAGSCDSDDDCNPRMLYHAEKVNAECHWATNLQKDFMVKWNDHNHNRPGQVLDKTIFHRCQTFFSKIQEEPFADEELHAKYVELYIKHVMVLWDFSVLTREQVRTLVDHATQSLWGRPTDGRTDAVNH